LKDYSDDSLINIKGGNDKSIAAYKDELTRYIQDLIRDPIDGDFLIIEADGRYIQFIYDENTEEIFCEAVSNEFLSPEQRISEERIGLLRAFGFKDPGVGAFVSPNFSRSWGRAEFLYPAHVASTVIQIFQDIYGCSLENGLSIKKGRQ
jgi:hypothetical protein